MSRGAFVSVVDVGITRAPVFKVNSKLKTQNSKLKLKNKKLDFNEWLEDNFGRLKEICEATSQHLKLLKIEPFFEEDAVFVRFSFDTGLAMGMNMATIASSAVSEYIEKETGCTLVALSGNVCCDKKASHLNFQKGRGKQVMARVFLTEKVLGEVLKTNARDFYEVYRLKIVLGSKVAQTIGKNAQIANIAAAIFLACGQDLAHVVEAAIGETKCKIAGDGIEILVWLPDLPIGVVGGGTGLATQKESLWILGVSGESGKSGSLGRETDLVLKFAEIVGAGVLAGEISLISALASNDLSRAHQRLGRNIQ